MQFALATIQEPTGPVAHALIGDRLHRIADIEPSLSGLSCLDLVRVWGRSFDVLMSAVDRYDAAAGFSIERAQLLTPIMYPHKLLAVGANYSSHLKEMGLQAQKWESMPFFMRPPKTSLVGPGKTVVIPPSTKQFDWECELAVVVGRRLRPLPPNLPMSFEQALDDGFCLVGSPTTVLEALNPAVPPPPTPDPRLTGTGPVPRHHRPTSADARRHA